MSENVVARSTIGDVLDRQADRFPRPGRFGQYRVR